MVHFLEKGHLSNITFNYLYHFPNISEYDSLPFCDNLSI